MQIKTTKEAPGRHQEVTKEAPGLHRGGAKEAPRTDLWFDIGPKADHIKRRTNNDIVAEV